MPIIERTGKNAFGQFSVKQVGAPVAGYKVWLDASDTTTITASSGEVSKWTDKSANAYTFSQGTAAYKPTTGANTQNGRNVLTFGASDALICDQAKSNFRFLHYGAYSAFMAYKVDSSATNGLLCDNAGTASQIGFIFYINSSNGFQHSITRGVSGEFVSLNTQNSVTDTNYTILSFYGDAASSTLANRSKVQFKQGSQIKNNTSSGSVLNSDSGQFLRIGDVDTGAGVSMVGKIAEILLYDSELSEADVLKNQQYLADKWAIA